MEPMSIEIIGAMAHNCSKKAVVKILAEYTRKHPYQNSTGGDRM